MPTKSARGMKGVDPRLAALAMDAGVTLKPARLSKVRDRYFLTVGATRKPLTVGETIAPSEANKFVGKDILAAVANRNVVAIGARFPRCYWIICYIPVPDLRQRISAEFRTQLLEKFVEEKIITKQFANELAVSR